jgi:hypothetical protein
MKPGNRQSSLWILKWCQVTQSQWTLKDERKD